MKDSKNKVLLISLAILLVVTGTVYFLQQAESRPAIDPGIFRVPNATAIDRVELESATGKTVLHFDSGHWKVNERFEADRALIDVLFAALAQALPKRPVAVALRDSVNRLLMAGGTRVSLFEGTTLRKEFVAGGDPQKRETYFRPADTPDTYLMAIPGYRVYLADIFSIDQNGWRDKRIFDFPWRNFKALTASIPSEPAAGFRIERPGMSMAVTLPGIATPDTTRVNTYLDDVLQLTADRFVPPGTKRYDSLALTRPSFSTEVTDISGRTYRLDLFGAVAGESQVLGRTHTSDLVLIDRKKLFRVVKKRSYFVGKVPGF